MNRGLSLCYRNQEKSSRSVHFLVAGTAALLVREGQLTGLPPGDQRGLWLMATFPGEAFVEGR